MFFLEAGIGLSAGLVAGWFLRSMRRGTERRVLDEIYTRKVRLAEQERDAAVVRLNENKVEMTTFQERFGSYEAEIARLQDEVRRLDSALAKTDAELKRREQDMARAREEISAGLADREEARIALAEVGRERTRQEYSDLLEAAGLKFTSLTPTHSPFQIIEASLA